MLCKCGKEMKQTLFDNCEGVIREEFKCKECGLKVVLVWTWKERDKWHSIQR